jgi:hypothetical protein
MSSSLDRAPTKLLGAQNQPPAMRAFSRGRIVDQSMQRVKKHGGGDGEHCGDGYDIMPLVWCVAASRLRALNSL